MLNRLLVAAVAVAATAISAQETENIEEIVVTATHRETNLMETPQAISAVSGQMIEELGVTNMQGLFRNITGLNMSEGASASNNRYAVRGVSSQTGTESYQQTYAAVSVYLDDVPMTSAQGPARQFGGNLFDIDRVEVLKGPQGTLFGEGSVGGTIRFIQNKPSLDGIDWKVRASVNQNEESSDLGHRLDGMLNLPVSDAFALRFTAFDENRAGWFENVPNNEEDTNSEQSTGGRIAALWVVSDRLSVEGSFFTVQTDTEGWVAGQSRYKEQLNVRIPGVTPQSTDQVDVFALNADYDFDWATLQLAASFMDRAAHSEREYAETVAAFFDWFIQFNIVARAGDNPDEIPALLAEGWQIDLANPTARTNQLAFNNDSTAESERTTFEAIVHALEALQIDHLVERVDTIWGVSESSDGRDQFRLSVTLTPGAVEEIRDNEDFDEKRFGGHVKRPNGHVVGRLVVPVWSFFTAVRQTDTVRQVRRGPLQASVQISWLESDERTADIDIDYLSIWRGNHGKPLNSDVRFGSHHEIHEQTFGRLTNWWSNGGP